MDSLTRSKMSRARTLLGDVLAEQNDRPSALDFARKGLVLAYAHSKSITPAESARQLYGNDGERYIMKAAVDGLDTSSELYGPAAANSAFAEAVRAASVLGGLNTRPAPFQTPLPYLVVGSTADFYGEGQPIVCSAPTTESAFLPHVRCSALTVVSNELLKFGAQTEQTLFRDLRNALAEAIDRRLLDPTSNAVDRTRPASVTYGATSIDVSGAVDAADVDAILASLIAALTLAGSTLRDAAFIMPPTVALAVSSLRTSGERSFPSLGARGGELLGLPTLVSAGAPAGVIVALDGGELLVADSGEADVELSRNAVIDMEDPVEGTTRVPMFSTEAVALRASRWISWKLRRPFVAYAENLDIALPQLPS